MNRTTPAFCLAALAALGQAAVATESPSLAPLFEGGIAADRSVDADVGQASWDAGCADVGDLGCCDAAGLGCCGTACGCCDAACRPCCNNCGLFAQGVLTHDPCGEGCVLPELLLGKLFCETEGCFDEFISPMTNPIYFEDPRTVTELRGIFWNHTVPQAAGGGQINLYALQIRARLSERLSLIATKDGYIVSSSPLIDDGWADVALGLKYALYRDARRQRLLSGGFVYDMPVGSTRSLQAKGGR